MCKLPVEGDYAPYELNVHLWKHARTLDKDEAWVKRHWNSVFYPRRFEAHNKGER